MKWYRIQALLLKYVYITMNRLDRIFDIFYWPLIGLLIWGFTSHFIIGITRDDTVLNFFLGGVILWTFYQRALQDIGNYILEDFWSRNLTNLLTTPVKPIEIIVSVIIFGLFRSIISFLVLAGLGYLLYAFNIFHAGIFVILIFSLSLLILGWVFGIFVAALIFRHGIKIQVLAWAFPFIIQPFSAVFYPISVLPVWLQKISLVVPATHAFEGMRQAYATGTIAWSHLAYSFLLNGVLLVLVMWFFLRCFEKSRREGVIARLE